MKYLLIFIQTHKRVRQRGTWYSLLVVVMLFGLFLEAYMHNFNLVYITLFFVFGIAFGAGSIGTFNLGRLEGKYSGSSRLFANIEGKLYFNIINKFKQTSWAIELYSDTSRTLVGYVRGETSETLSIDIVPKRRGDLECKDSYLQSFFPLSTVRFILPIETTYQSLVYPEPKGISLRSFLNRHKSYFGEEKDFDGLAPYSGVESPSRIHWASVAKGEMAVKIFSHEEHTEALYFKFKNSGKNTEARLSQLCLWILACEKSYHPFVIEMPNKILSSKKESIDEILTHLARY
ncbi:MAG: hypothetical protein JJV88_05235 [Sulfurovum sp.]|nr:hypothetical protein [Sulfurovaceae bacterium]